MKLAFRQGIVRHQRDPQGTQTFLQRVDGGTAISLLAGTDPTLVTIAQGQSNYLIEERATVLKAWTGFSTGTSYWLYLDIDQVTGRRTFGWTTLSPMFGPTAPTAPTEDQHWFDTRPNVMCQKVFNGSTFVPVLRVFLAQYQNGSTIIPLQIGSQINVNKTCEAGYVLFDHAGQPVRLMISRTEGYFATTSTIFSTYTSKSVNVTLDSLCSVVSAAEPIPAFSLVARGSVPDEIVLADCNSHGRQALGMVQEDFFQDETGIYTTLGYITNESWNWTQLPGTLLYLGEHGQLETAPSQRHTIQLVGYIVNTNTIMLDIKQQIHYDNGQAFTNLVPLNIDRSTGQLVATSVDPASGQLGDNEYKAGYSHNQTQESSTWVINHNRGSVKYVAQVVNRDGILVYPDSIETRSASQIVVTFSSPQTGTANIVFFDATLTAPYYDVSASVTSAMELGEVIIIQPAPSDSELDPVNSYAYAKNPATATLNITADGVLIGTITFTEDSNIGTITAITVSQLTANQIIEIAAPTVPTALSTIGLRLRFTNTGV